EIPASKLKVEIAKILKSEGFIRNYALTDKDKIQAVLRVDLKYSPDGEPVIHGIERISRPGRRVYRNKQEIPSVLGALGLAIVSTSKGVLAGHEAAKNGIGGEVLCQVWEGERPMSHIGNKPISLPKGVEVKKDNGKVVVKGPKGSLTTAVVPGIEVKVENNV